MKHCKFIPALLILLLVASGCDTIRALLGKPTSEDIERIRQEKLQAAEKARQDSIEMVRAAEELQRAQEEAQKALEEQAAQVQQVNRYNVMVGVFSKASNAEKMVETLKQLGETAITIEMKNGRIAVSALNTDDRGAAEKKAKELNNCKKASFSCWIYDSKTEKHK